MSICFKEVYVQTILTKLSDEKAQKELKPFALWGIGLSGVSLVVFWPLGIAGVACGARALLLAWHKGNKRRNDLLKYRLVSFVAIAVGFVSILYGQ